MSYDPDQDESNLTRDTVTGCETHEDWSRKPDAFGKALGDRHVTMMVIYRNVKFGVICHDRATNPWEAGRMNLEGDAIECNRKSFAFPMHAIQHAMSALEGFAHRHGDHVPKLR